MIGGTDIIIECMSSTRCAENALQFIKVFWPNCLIEKDDDNLFVYKDQFVYDQWVKQTWEPNNTMIHIILDKKYNIELTLVVDDPNAEPIKGLINDLRKSEREMLLELVEWSKNNKGD